MIACVLGASAFEQFVSPEFSFRQNVAYSA
jgi:hypothetical protein